MNGPMKRICILLLLLWAFSVSALASDSSETYFKFRTPDRNLLDKLSRMVSIDNVTSDEVYAYANARELARFEAWALPTTASRTRGRSSFPVWPPPRESWLIGTPILRMTLTWL